MKHFENNCKQQITVAVLKQTDAMFFYTVIVACEIVKTLMILQVFTK